MKILSRTYMWVIFALLYAPILVLVIFSFNDGGSLSSYTGVSFRWYGELFRDQVALQSLKNSFFLAASSSLLSTVIGTFAALGLDRMRNRYVKGTVNSVTNIPMMNTESPRLLKCVKNVVIIDHHRRPDELYARNVG